MHEEDENGSTKRVKVDPTPFGNALDAALQSAEMSAMELARRIYSSSGYISSVKYGFRRPPLDRLWKWADCLGLSGYQRKCFAVLALVEHCPEPVYRWILSQLSQDPFNDDRNEEFLNSILVHGDPTVHEEVH